MLGIQLFMFDFRCCISGKTNWCNRLPNQIKTTPGGKTKPCDKAQRGVEQDRANTKQGASTKPCKTKPSGKAGWYKKQLGESTQGGRSKQCGRW